MRVKKKVKKLKTRTRRKNFFSRGRASMYVFLFILLLSFASYVFIGGVTSKNYLTEPNIPPGTQPVDIVRTTDPGDEPLPGPGTPGYVTPGGPTVTRTPGSSTSKENLQLKTLKFTPRPTTVKECLETVAVDFLVDRSGSMETDGPQLPDGRPKITATKTAIETFTQNLSDESLVGLQSFSSTARNDVPISLFGSVRDTFIAKVQALRGSGSTAMRSGMQTSLEALQQGIATYPGRNFNLIMLTDGQPTSGQDPLTSSVPNDIKALGVTIFTIGIMGTSNDNAQRDRLRQIASTSDKFYESPTGSDLTEIYNQIGQRLCE